MKYFAKPFTSVDPQSVEACEWACREHIVTIALSLRNELAKPSEAQRQADAEEANDLNVFAPQSTDERARSVDWLYEYSMEALLAVMEDLGFFDPADEASDVDELLPRWLVDVAIAVCTVVLAELAGA